MTDSVDEQGQKAIEMTLPNSNASTAALKEEVGDMPLPPAIVPPDGGLQAWMAVAGGFLVTFCTFGYATSFGVFEDYYVHQHTSTSSNISWIGSLQLFLLFAVGLPAGRLFDAGYFRHISIFGTLLFSFSIFMLSLADPKQYYQLILAQGVGMGIGSGFLLTPALSLQSHHWRKHRARSLGIVQSGSSFGGIILPIMLNQLFNSSVGFAWGVRATAFMVLGLLTIANCIMYTRLPVMKDRPKVSFKAVVTDPPYAISLIAVFLVLLGMFLPYFYLQLWVNTHKLSSTLAFYTIAILNAGSIFGRIVPNIIADYAGQFNVFLPICVVTSALIFAMFGAKTTGSVIIFTILYGFFSGSCIALFPASLAIMAKSTDEMGLRIGLAFFTVAFAILFGSPITGALIGSTYEWYKAILFSGVVMVAGSVLLFIARHLLVLRKGTQHT